MDIKQEPLDPLDESLIDIFPSIKSEIQTVDPLELQDIKKEGGAVIDDLGGFSGDVWSIKPEVDSSIPTIFDCNGIKIEGDLRKIVEEENVEVHFNDQEETFKDLNSANSNELQIKSDSYEGTQNIPNENQTMAEYQIQEKGSKKLKIPKACGRQKPCNCRHCKEIFDNEYISCESMCKTNIETYNEKKLYKCKICESKFNSQSSLKCYAKTRSQGYKLICKICFKKFSQKSNSQIPTITCIGNNKYSCKFCDKKFVHSSSLARHIRTHNKDPYSCKFCDKTFNMKYNLQIHLRTHTGEKRHSCKFCDKNFSDESHLARHFRTHTGEKPYTCKFCHKKFSANSYLRIHIRTHTGEKPYSCKVCDKKFIQALTLKRHIITHTRKNPYSCKFCDENFSNGSLLAKHTRTHTGEKLV